VSTPRITSPPVSVWAGRAESGMLVTVARLLIAGERVTVAGPG
jgi:multidrug efflux pump subunit AcrA (membrane-fusion protein)